VRWAGRVERLRENKIVYRVLVGKPERGHWGDEGVDGNILLRWVFRKMDVGLWTGSSWLRIGTVGEHL